MTPPFPAPTRMMFFTPGVSCPWAAPGAERTWAPQDELDGAKPRALERRLHVAINRALERARRRGELDLEPHGVALHDDVLHHPQGHEVAVSSGSITLRSASRAVF